jgi:hypothetical protein
MQDADLEAQQRGEARIDLVGSSKNRLVWPANGARRRPEHQESRHEAEDFGAMTPGYQCSVPLATGQAFI